MKDKTFKNLRLFNGVMGFFHLAQGVLMLVLANDFKLPVTTSFLSSSEAGQFPSPMMDEIGQVKLAPFIAAFLFISATAHFLLASPKVYDWYVKNLKKGMNPARWFEYTFSSSIMIVVIAMLSGLYDLPSMIMMFSLNAMMILMGYMMELHNQTTKKTDWTSFWLGCFAGFVPWIVIGMYFLGAELSTTGTIPDFVYVILISLFLFFNVFAVNMYLQYKKVGPWKNYLFGEKMYIVLSLLAKSALAWQVFAGTLRPS